MASERLEDLQFFYSICLKEHGRALRNLEEYLKKITSIWKVIEDNRIVDLKLFGSAATDFSQMGEVLRKFNIEVELSSSASGPYRLTEPSFTQHQSSTVDHYQDTALNSNLKASNTLKTRAAEKLLDIDDLNDFDTACSVSAKHVQNYAGDCIITSVKDAKNMLVYITDISRPYSPVDLTKYFKGTPKRLTRVPNVGVVFGYFFENYMFRVVRSSIDIQASADVGLFLIDVGEITFVPVETEYFYDLPDKYQQIPPQAMLCHVLKMTGYAESDPEKLLAQNQYEKHKFRILNCSNNVLDIEMMPVQSSLEGQVKENPFQRMRCELPNDIAGPSNHKRSVDAEYEPSIGNDGLSNGGRKSYSSTSANHSGVTEEQRKILYEEPLGTDNAMQAVMGYNPKDDKRICPFYDQKLNGCFKGARCRLEHVEKLKDGWTRDRDTLKLNNHGDAPLPKVGSTIRIVPTHIVNYDKFYAQIPDRDDNYPSLREIIIDMNKTETEGRYRPMTKLPSEHELVIAKYTDGRWYRCRVLSVIDEDNIKVFYVDYGNCAVVSVHSIRVWDELFDYYPFQAYLCKLDNIENATKFNAEATDLVRKIMLNKILTATVTNNLSQLCLTVLDTNGDDVGQSLCEMKYAIPKEVTRISTKQRFLPA